MKEPNILRLIDCHFTRDKVLEGLQQLYYLPTSSQIVDVLTKVLPRPQFQELLSKLGMVNALDPSSLREGVISIFSYLLLLTYLLLLGLS